MTKPAQPPNKPSGRTPPDRPGARPAGPARAAGPGPDETSPDLASTTGGGTGTPHAVPMPPSSGQAGAKKG